MSKINNKALSAYIRMRQRTQDLIETGEEGLSEGAQTAVLAVGAVVIGGIIVGAITAFTNGQMGKLGD